MQPSRPVVYRAWRVLGRVQGVGFRWWTVRSAERLGVRGTVCNRPDGSVEVCAAGDAAAVRRLGARLRDGPPGARVDAVERLPDPDSLPPDFRVIR